MTYDPQQHQRRSIRLKGYDYSQPGAYFVTICTQNRESLLGEIVEGEMILNEYGRVVAGCWVWLANQYPYVQLDESVVMTTHAHSIVILSGMDGSRRGGWWEHSKPYPPNESTKCAAPLARWYGSAITTNTSSEMKMN